MANEKNLKPFKKGVDPRRKKNPRKGVVSVVTAVKNFLNEVAKDGEEYQKKLGKAIVLRAITKSDKLAEAIMERTDGKVAQGIDLGNKNGQPFITSLEGISDQQLDVIISQLQSKIGRGPARESKQSGK